MSGIPHPPSHVSPDLALLERMGFERHVPAATAREATANGAGFHRRAFPAMTTMVDVTVRAVSNMQASAAMELAAAEMQSWIALFNRHDASSVTSALNERGSLEQPPEPFSKLLVESVRFHRMTRGAFDVTVAPLVDLMRQSTRPNASEPPSRKDVVTAGELVGLQHLSVSERRVRLTRSGMALTFDGIAKGAIVDAMVRVLEHHGIRDYCINAGGDLRVRTAGASGSPWTVAIQDAAHKAAPIASISLRRGAVATAGGVVGTAVQRRRGHHVRVDSNGRVHDEAVSVTVIAPSASVADALATSALVLGRQHGLALIESLPRCACCVLDRRGRIHASSRWKRMAQPTNTGVGRT